MYIYINYYYFFFTLVVPLQFSHSLSPVSLNQVLSVYQYFWPYNLNSPFLTLRRIWDCIAVRGQPPRSVHLPRDCPPSAQTTTILFSRCIHFKRERQHWNNSLPGERLGAELPHGATGDFRDPDCTWLHHPGPGKQRHQEPKGLPAGPPLLLPGVTEAKGQLVSGAVHMHGDGESEHAWSQITEGSEWEGRSQ